jgi:outer membrane protein TolC
VRALLLLAALLAAAPAPSPGLAQRPAPERARALTLEEAERLLVERNLAVIAAQRGVDQARALRLVASSIRPMEVTVGNSWFEVQERRGGGGTARGYSPGNNILVGLTAVVELGGKRELRTRLAEENIGVAEAQVLDALRGQVLALRQGFIAALAARANLDVALAVRSSLERTEALLRRQVQDGARAEVDLLTFQASRPAFEAELSLAAQAHAAAVAQVAALLALDAAAVAPSPRPGALPALALDLRGRLDRTPEPALTRAQLAEAVQHRPDVVAAARLAQAGAANTNLAEAGRWRDVTLNGNWGRSRLSQDQPVTAQPLVANNQFTLSLSVPLFTGRIVEGNIGAAQSQQAQAEAQARAALLQARAEFATAWSAMEQARNLLRLYTGGALTRAEQAYRSVETAYQSGGRSLLEVLDALRTLNATRLAANNARAAYLAALAQLEAASGTAGISPRL